MRGRPDVGMCNDNSLGSRSDRNDPASFARESTFAGANMGWIERNRGSAVRSFEVRGHLEMALGLRGAAAKLGIPASTLDSEIEHPGRG